MTHNGRKVREIFDCLWDVKIFLSKLLDSEKDVISFNLYREEASTVLSNVKRIMDLLDDEECDGTCGRTKHYYDA